MSITFIFFLGLISYSTNIPFQWKKICEDGTRGGHCSLNKPFYCSGKTLVRNVNKCGCDKGYEIVGENCEKIPTCVGGILYGECSTNKPFYCGEEGLIQQASKCGCPEGEVIRGERCEPQFY